MISQHAMQSIGWALIHSLWQGLTIYSLLQIGRRLTDRADVRYGMGVSALVLMVISSAATFFILDQAGVAEGFDLVLTTGTTGSLRPISFLQSALQFIDQNIIWLLRFWILGFVVGLLRIAAGLWYINRLRRNSSPAQEEFNKLLQELSTTLKITKAVTMAEAAIASPMVVGFVKPVVLFPVGLLAGLTMEQVETILVHELSHIRRQDYIINLVQAVIETIFFFNPFALLISSFIREERENCCDDLVIAKGISPITYVKTLAQLEASRTSSTLVLGIAGNQNQLLNRIKRIMENSAKNDWGKGRFVPVALLFLGLICASWLSIGSEKKEEEVKVAPEQFSKVMLVSDTSKTKIKLAKPIEPFEPLAIPEFFEVPAVPDLDFDFFGMSDSIPGSRFHYRDAEEWDAFEKEFTEKFRERFKDFYSKNQKQFDKMFDEMKAAGMERDEARARREAAAVVDLQGMFRHEAQMKAIHDQEIAINLDQMALMASKMQADQAMGAQMLAKIAADQNFEILNEQLRINNDMFEDMARRYEEFQQVLVEKLVEDGYLNAGENIDQLQINDENGEMIINGKSIKEKDKIKYRALRDQFFKKNRVPRIPGRSE